MSHEELDRIISKTNVSVFTITSQIYDIGYDIPTKRIIMVGEIMITSLGSKATIISLQIGIGNSHSATNRITICCISGNW